jgi:hypothetical protein
MTAPESSNEDAEWEAAGRILAGRDLLSRAAELLSPRGITVCALKGVLISALAEARGEAPRPMLDVDVLIPEARRAEAERVLTRVGMRTMARSATATTLRDPVTGMDLDLHVRLVEPGLFALEERGFLSRSVPSAPWLDGPMRMPAPSDLYAHLIAHFVRNRSNAHDLRRLHDLVVVAETFDLEPRALASHLERLGLARAARYTLGLAARAGDERAGQVRGALSHDALGDVCAGAIEAWLKHRDGPSFWAVPAPYVLDSSLASGALGLGRHLAVGTALRGRRMLERATKRSGAGPG